MGQELVVPDWANQGPAKEFAVLNPADDNLSDGIGQSYPVVAYKGKQWSLRHRGERKNFVRPDDGTPASYLDVIILGQAKQKSKSYYKKFDPNQAEGERPICSSINGVVPDPDVAAKQSDTCALCERNVWRTDANGKKGRDCQDYKRLAVLVLPAQTKPLFGQPVVEPAFLRVPPASLQSLAIMGETMASKGYHYASYITRITFDPNEAHPKMQFRPLQGLTPQEAPTVLQMRQDMQVDRIINGGFVETMRTVPQQAVATGLIEAVASAPSIAAANGQGSRSPVTIEATPLTVSSAIVSAQPATPAGPAQDTGISTGLADLAGPTPTSLGSATPVAQPQISDTGAPEATDADLDKAIEGMLGLHRA